MKKRWKVILTVLVFAAAFICGRKGAEITYAIQDSKPAERIVWIDPGHGGADPGKVGVRDVLEKDINLQISMLLKEELEKRDIQVLMTRTEDVDLAEEGAGSRKVSDLNNRCKMMNESDAALTICVHQNSFTDSSVQGAQVFYCSGSEDGKKVAQLIQTTLREKVDPDNTREIKENDSYYMLKNTGIPIVIVECGFLSNAEETQKLSDEAYQAQIAEAIAEGVLKYFDGASEETVDGQDGETVDGQDGETADGQDAATVAEQDAESTDETSGE